MEEALATTVRCTVSKITMLPGAASVAGSTFFEKRMVISVFTQKPSRLFSDPTFGVTANTGAFSVPSTLPLRNRSVG